MNKKILLTSLVSYGMFATVFAQNTTDCKAGSVTTCITNVGSIIDNVNTSVVTALGTLFLAATVVGFLLGVVRFIWAQQNGDEKGVTRGKETLKWGILAIFCAFSIYGIIKFMQNTLLPVQDPSTITVPRIKIEGKNGTGAGSGSNGQAETPANGTGAGSGSNGQAETPANGTGAGSGSNGRAESLFGSIKFGSGVTNTNSNTQTGTFESGAGGSVDYGDQAQDVPDSIDGSIQFTQPEYIPQGGE